MLPIVFFPESGFSHTSRSPQLQRRISVFKPREDALQGSYMILRKPLFTLLFCILPVVSGLAQSQSPLPPGSAGKPPKSASLDGKTSAQSLSDESVIVEQYATVLHFAADGTGARTVTARVKVQSEAGLRLFGLLDFPYAQQVEHIQIKYLRVRKADGRVIDTPPEDAQDLPSEVTREAPMYSDIHQKQIPVKSLSVGDTLEYQISMELFKPLAPEQFWDVVNFLVDEPVLEETVELRVPKDKYVQVTSPSLAPVTTEEAGERVYRWKRSHAVPTVTKDTKQQPEPPKEWIPSIAITSFHNWAEIGEWYRGLSKDRVVPSAAVKSKADELTKGLTTDDAKIAAIYDYVSMQYRYMAVDFGIGRYQPHTAEEVFNNQFGDCKDKHTLLTAMLKAEGIEAWPVLVGAGIKLNPAIPTPVQFNHVITLVPAAKGNIWLDSTPEIAPEQVLISTIRKKQVLVIPAEKAPFLAETPSALPFESSLLWAITGKIDSEGTLKAHFDVTFRGDVELLYRSIFHQVPRVKWQELVQGISQRTGFGGDVSDVVATIPEKTRDPFSYSYSYERKEFGGSWKNKHIPLPIIPLDFPYSTGDKPAIYPIDMGEPSTQTFNVTLTLPEGYKAELPENVKLKASFADYDATYTATGHDITAHRLLRIKVNEVPPSAWKEYKKFAEDVAEDTGREVQLVGSGLKAPEKTAKSDPEAADLVQQAWNDLNEKTPDLEGAKKALDAAQKLNPTQEGLWRTYGWLYDLQHLPEQSVPYYQKEVDLHPDDSENYRLLQREQIIANQLDAAEKTAIAWRVEDPKSQDGQQALLWIYASQEKYAEELKVLKDISPRSDQEELQMGIAQIHAGDKAAGAKTLKNLLETTQDPLMRNDLAYELGDNGMELEAALDGALKALSEDEKLTQDVSLDSPTKEQFLHVNSIGAVWDTVGWIYFQQGNLKLAETYLKAAWILCQRDEVGDHLGQLYEKQNRADDALHSYSLASAANRRPNLDPATRRLHEKMNARIAALKASGAKEKPFQSPQGLGGDEIGLERSTLMPRLTPTPSSADFYIQFSPGGVVNVKFIKGDAALEKATAQLREAKFNVLFPDGSQAKIVRRGILACSPSPGVCEFVLIPPNSTAVL